MRSPSGSPLSSLGPTPQKPKVKREMVVVKKEPDFFFDFEVHVRKPTLRRERSQTLNELDATDGEDEEDEMVVDEEEEDVVVGASGSKRNSPGSGRKLAHDGTLSGSESDSDSARDSADESDDDIVAAALARAKARREGGTALVTSDAISAHPSSSNALAGPSSPDIRRSSRAIAKGESAAMESERKKQERERSKMKSEMGLAGLASAGLKGKLGMVALQREREERESRGRGLAWEEGKRLLAMEEERGYVRFTARSLSVRRADVSVPCSCPQGSDDSNASTNSSRSMDKKPILHADSLSDLVTAAANVTGDQDDEYAAFAGSPQKREKKAAAQKRADAIADALKSEVGNGGRTEEEEEEQRLWAKRCFWREGAKVAPWVESVEEVKGEWSERVEMAIRGKFCAGWVVRRFAELTHPLRRLAAGRQDSKLFPCSLNLFSHVNGLGTPEERAHIAKRLLSLSETHLPPCLFYLR